MRNLSATAGLPLRRNLNAALRQAFPSGGIFMQGCGRLSPSEETFTQGCGRLSPSEETSTQGYSRLSPPEETFTQGCGRLSLRRKPSCRVAAGLPLRRKPHATTATVFYAKTELKYCSYVPFRTPEKLLYSVSFTLLGQLMP
jgi:hypothetical protein